MVGPYKVKRGGCGHLRSQKFHTGSRHAARKLNDGNGSNSAFEANGDLTRTAGSDWGRGTRAPPALEGVRALVSGFRADVVGAHGATREALEELVSRGSRFASTFVAIGPHRASYDFKAPARGHRGRLCLIIRLLSSGRDGAEPPHSRELA